MYMPSRIEQIVHPDQTNDMNSGNRTAELISGNPLNTANPDAIWMPGRACAMRPAVDNNKTHGGNT